MDLLAGELFAVTAEKGLKKTKNRLMKTLVSSMLAGVYIGIGYIAYLKTLSVSDGDYASLIGASLFPLGLTLVLVAGAELFTVNCMDVAMAFFSKKITFPALVKNWALVFVGNFLGSFLLAFVYGEGLGFTKTLLAENILGPVVLSKISSSPLQMIVSGMFCNIMVCLGVWLANSTKNNASKAILLWVPITVFVFLGLQHSVANMFLLSAGLLAGVNTFGQMLVNLLFVGLGNMIGGALFVGGSYSYLNKN